MTQETLSALIQKGIQMPKNTPEEIEAWQTECYRPIIWALRDEPDTLPGIYRLTDNEKDVMIQILFNAASVAKELSGREDLLEVYVDLCSERDGNVGLFFCVERTLINLSCPLALAEPYGDNLTCPDSHDEMWRNPEVNLGHPVDYDYYPRGRVVYNTKTELFTVYIDHCLDTPELIADLLESFGLVDKAYKIDYDEHYQCHMCNENYVE
jgi:hypothetical protein